jgi:DNA-binding NtrC family response regulator
MIDFTIGILDNDKERAERMAQAISEVFKVCTFDSGQAVLSSLKKNPLELVIIDFNIPDINSLQLQQEINKDFPDTHTVMMTSIDRSKCVIESMKRRAMDYIYKTDDQERFRSDVCKLVRFLIEEKKRRKAESALRETGLYNLIKDVYEDRKIDIEAIKKEIDKIEKKNQ